MTRDPRTTVRGSSKAVAMLDLWASVKHAARDRAPEDRDQAGEGQAEPQGRPGVPAARPPVHVVAE